MKRLLLGDIPVSPNSKGLSKAKEDDGYDTDVLDGAHILATMIGVSRVADKDSMSDESKTTTDNEEQRAAAFALMALSPAKRRYGTMKSAENVSNKKQAVSNNLRSPKRVLRAGKTVPTDKFAPPIKSYSTRISTDVKSSETANLTSRNTMQGSRIEKTIPMDLRAIPTSWDEIDEADKTLLAMKNAGESWADIAKVYQQKTGKVSQPSSLANRLARIKCNMTKFKKGDDAFLMVAKEHVEKRFAHDKWKLIARRMRDCYQTDDYPTAFLRKEAINCQAIIDKDTAPGKKLASAIAKAKAGELAASSSSTADEDSDDCDNLD